MSMATVDCPRPSEREKTFEAANRTERESNMYLSSRTRIDIIDKCGKAPVCKAFRARIVDDRRALHIDIIDNRSSGGSSLNAPPRPSGAPPHVSALRTAAPLPA